jgi:hypothetical protein
MPQFRILEPGFSLMVWSHDWWVGSRCEAVSLKTLEYLWNCTGSNSFCSLGVAFAASVVLVVVFARIARLLRFAKRCPTWTRVVWMQPLMTQL